MTSTTRALLAVVLLAATPLTPLATARAAAPVQETPVVGSRVHLSDIVHVDDEEAAALDLGPAPPPGGSRLILKADILAALDVRHLDHPSRLPDAVRVVHRTRRVGALEVERMVRDAMAAEGMPRGATLTSVKPPAKGVEVGDGWTKTRVAVPKPPKRAGSFATMVVLSLLHEDEVLGQVSVPVEMDLSADAARYDAPRGAAVTLVVRRNLVEVRIAAVTAADADVGDLVPILLRPAGRVVRSRLVEKDEAVALEGTE